MRIAFTHNLQRQNSVDEAEFDTAHTVEAITESLERLGHQVFPVEVSRPLDVVIDELKRLEADLVFNTAEGFSGRSREAVYPMVFEQLDLPYTGSDSFVCTTTLDKRLTKMLVGSRGVPTPEAVLVEDIEDQVPDVFRFPVIVKPNFEGSSKGIDQRSIVHEPADLDKRVAEMLSQYPCGVLVEEFVVGEDIVVPFLEGVSPQTSGILPAAQYRVSRPEDCPNGFEVYDYDLKHDQCEAVSVEVPADLPDSARDDLVEYSRRVIDVLGVRDLGRLDFRVTPDGEVYFLEINALPSLEPEASIYASARLVGLDGIDAVLGAVVRSACARQGLDPGSRAFARSGRRSTRAPHRPTRVGLIYNLKRAALDADGTNDLEAEFDSAQTVASLAEAIAANGHEVVPLEATPELPAQLARADIDVAFNIAEGYGGRSRESAVPALLELHGIPYTGSDTTAMALTLDKAIAKRLVSQEGIATPRFSVIRSDGDRIADEIRYPVIVKPVAEGTSKGIGAASVCHNDADALARAAAIIERYPDGALVEEFLGGREFTLGLLGERDPQVLPPLEVVFSADEQTRVYSYSHKIDADQSVRFEVPAHIEPGLKTWLESVARRVFAVLGCRDLARVDIRLDDNGEPHFIECNPLPGLAPGWSDLCLIAQAAGMQYHELIGEILAPALRRLEKQRDDSSQPIRGRASWTDQARNAAD